MFPCLLLLFFENPVHGRFTLFTDTADPDLMSKHW